MKILTLMAMIYLGAVISEVVYNDSEVMTEKVSRPEVIFENDDILLTPEQESAIYNQVFTISNVTNFWPDRNGLPYIPFVFEDDKVNRKVIRAAVKHWEDNTCIVFDEVDVPIEGPHIRFQHHNFSCASYIGMIDDDEGQVVKVSNWCSTFRKMVHMIGHAVGLWHETQKISGLSMLKLLYHNLRPSCPKSFFAVNTNEWLVHYDFQSIMHPRGQMFTKNGKNTVVPIDPRYQSRIGKSTELSHSDKVLTNKMYKCAAKLPLKCKRKEYICYNLGFLGMDCNCICPKGTSGDFCQNIITAYYDADLTPYTETITREKTISTPNYPNRFPPNSDFVKWIKAPACAKVRLTFEFFNVYPKTTKIVDGVRTTQCWDDALEIRIDKWVEGKWYCGTSISPGQVFEAEVGDIILNFKGRSTNSSGWSAIVGFVYKRFCSI